ncbi:hypothetical protein ACFLUU_07820 [Chloroflexota bacterium]
MVKCADCGFLSVMLQSDGSYVEANRFYRMEGFQGYQKDAVYCEPHCSIHCQSIHSEPLAADGAGVQLTDPGGGLVSLKNDQGEDVTDKAVLAIITKSRTCEGFYLWRSGFSPKENYEMLDRQRWQEWQEEQRRRDKRWHIIEGIIFVILAGLFTLLGAYIASFN